MTGEKDLEKMLASLSPELSDREYVFCTFPNARYGDFAQFGAIAAVVETEGLTLIIPRATADNHQLGYEAVFRCITLTIHSSLTAIGLTATSSNTLAEHGISANVIAGYFHDHIFVQSEHAERAVAALKSLARQGR